MFLKEEIVGVESANMDSIENIAKRSSGSVRIEIDGTGRQESKQVVVGSLEDYVNIYAIKLIFIRITNNRTEIYTLLKHHNLPLPVIIWEISFLFSSMENLETSSSSKIRIIVSSISRNIDVS